MQFSLRLIGVSRRRDNRRDANEIESAFASHITIEKLAALLRFHVNRDPV